MAWINWKIRYFIIPFLLMLPFIYCCGQDTLPDFNAYVRSGKKVQINWVNNFGNRVRQLSVQRSRDSLRLFKTIYALPDPSLPRNGYIDQKLPDNDFYYRLYILLDSGRYIFSTPRKPIKELSVTAVKKTAGQVQDIPKVPVIRAPAGVKPSRPISAEPQIKEPVLPAPPEELKVNPVPLPPPEKTYIIKRFDSIAGSLNESALKKFRDSLSVKTKDTIASIRMDTIYIRPFIPKELFKLSKYVFMDKSGVLHVELPDAGKKKYRVVFYEENRIYMFELKEPRDQMLLLDKSNFGHAGWFLFEIYDDGILLEKNRFFIGRDF